MNKLLSVIVPCYNSQDYLRRAVDSLLPGGDRLEILIVDDGSTDATGLIADDYARSYPQRVRAIHQPNGGHGGAIMAGLREASGRYFRVVDSDDWVEPDALTKTLDALEALEARGEPVDMFITNFIFDKAARHRHRVRYKGVLPEGWVFGWEDTRRFRVGDLLMIHAVSFRTGLLRDCGLALPEHCCYEDNLFVYLPLSNVEKLYYLDVDLYHYVIGRQGQSTQVSVILKRLDQQLAINREMFRAVELDWTREPKRRYYMLRYIEMVTSATVVYLLLSGRREDEAKLDAFLREVRECAPKTYRWFCRYPVTYSPIVIFMYSPKWLARRLINALYRFAQWYFAF